MASKDELRAQLTDVNEQINTLGGEADAAFADAGTNNDDGPRDNEEVAADLTMAQENEALLQPLYERRGKLHAELAE